MFIEIVRCGAEVAGAAGAYQYCSVHKIGGGFLGGLLAGIFCPNFGLLGSYVIEPEREFTIGDLTIEPVSISHDAADPVAYKIRQQEKNVAVMTDLGTYDDHIVEKLQNVDVLLLEANHDVRMLQAGAYPYPLKQRILGDKGHLSNERSGQLLGKVLHDHLKHIVLGHLSKENNYPELAYETVRLEVELGDNPYKGDDFPMFVAKRDEVSQKIVF